MLKFLNQWLMALSFRLGVEPAPAYRGVPVRSRRRH